MSQIYKYRNHPRSLLSHASFLSQIVPLHSPCSHESGDILFVPKKCFYGAKIYFTKCCLSFWSTMCQAPCQAFQFFHIWILLIKMRAMVYHTWWQVLYILAQKSVYLNMSLKFPFLFQPFIQMSGTFFELSMFIPFILVIFTILFDKIW